MNTAINTKIEPAKPKQSNRNKVIIGTSIGLLSGGFIGAKASKLKHPTEDQVLLAMKNQKEVQEKYLTSEYQAKEQYIAKLKEDKGALDAIDVKNLKDEDKAFLKSVGIDALQNKTPEEFESQIKNAISEREKNINLLTGDIEKIAEEEVAEETSKLYAADAFDQKITKAYRLGLESLPGAKDVNKKVLTKEYKEFLGGISNEQLKKAETFEDLQKMFLKEIGFEDTIASNKEALEGAEKKGVNAVNALKKKLLEDSIFNKYKSQRPGNKVINNFNDLVFSPQVKEEPTGEKIIAETEGSSVKKELSEVEKSPVKKELSEMDELFNIKNEKIKKIKDELTQKKSVLEKEIKKIAETIPEDKVDKDFILKTEGLKSIKSEVEQTMKKAVFMKWATVAATIGAVIGGIVAHFVGKTKKGS